MDGYTHERSAVAMTYFILRHIGDHERSPALDLRSTHVIAFALALAGAFFMSSTW
jgi:hypothetical protein